MLVTFPESCSNKLGWTIKVTHFPAHNLTTQDVVQEKNPSEAEEMSWQDDRNDR